MQVYRTSINDLKLWFEADSHAQTHIYDEATAWGGLWTAIDAESFAKNAVYMYTSEGKWEDWQHTGCSLADALYSTKRLQIIQASSCVAPLNVLLLHLLCAIKSAIAGYSHAETHSIVSILFENKQNNAPCVCRM